MGTKLSTNVRIFAFSAIASTLVGAGAIAPVTNTIRAAEPSAKVMLSSAAVVENNNEVASASMLRSAAEQPASEVVTSEAKGTSIAAPVNGFIDLTDPAALFDLLCQLLFGGLELPSLF